MHLSDILGSLKRAWEGKKVMEHHQTVARPHGTQVGGQLFGVHLPNFNLKILILKQNFLFP